MTMSQKAGAARAQPYLAIHKRFQHIQGRTRPCCFIQAIVPEELTIPLLEHFPNEALFKRASYARAWPENAITIPAAIEPHVANLLKSDACPEITVKTLLSGQQYQGNSISDMMAFELISKLAFDNLFAILDTVAELDRTVVYAGYHVESEQTAFTANTNAERQNATPKPESFRAA